MQRQGTGSGGTTKGGGRVIEGQVKVGVGSGAGADGVQRWSSCGGGDLVSGGIDPERGRQLPQHRSFGGGVEGGNDDFKFLLRRLHHLP